MKEILDIVHMEKGDTENPLQSLLTSMTGDPRDFGTDKGDAWRYGIVCGWNNASYRELQQQHGWSDETVKRNKRLHRKYIKAWLYIQNK